MSSLRTAFKVPSPVVSSVRIAHPTEADRDDFLAMNVASRAFHSPWAHPPRTAAGFRELLERDARDDCEAFLVRRTSDDALVGVFVLSQIYRQGFQSAYLGYYAFEPLAGSGLMHEGLELLVRHAFDELGLHRIQANVQPANVRSVELLRRSGFQLEGFEPRYLLIDGAWRDHLAYVRLAEETPPVLSASGPVVLREVSTSNWRDVRQVRATREQSKWVADTATYLTLCRYGGNWVPLAIEANGSVVGFVMWARDPADGSYWIGGFVIDRRRQRQGLGAAALDAVVTYLRRMPQCRGIALSYRPDNAVAKALYATRGFVETGEVEDGEVVARLRVRRRA